MRVLITGVTRTGNLGGTAMLCAVEDVLRSAGVNEIFLASILPAVDRERSGPDTTRILDTGYRGLILLGLPLCLLFWPLRHVRMVRRFLGGLPILRNYASMDAVADLSGIAFVDGRGIGLLAYNAAVVVPALFFDVPVHKLSQALGPFQQRLNRLVARAVLSRCAWVSARGQVSFDNLKELGLSNISSGHDVSFALRIHDRDRERAKTALCEAFGDSFMERPLVILSPSRVVRDYSIGAGIDFDEEFARLVEQLRARDIGVALLPHSMDTGIRKNDDAGVCDNINGLLAARGGTDVPVLDAGGDPRLARAMIGEASVFLACRFHSMIAALSQAVPVLTIGWSHKYREAGKPFGMEGYTLDFSEMTADGMADRLFALLVERDRYRERMAAVAARAASSAEQGVLRVIGVGARNSD